MTFMGLDNFVIPNREIVLGDRVQVTAVAFSGMNMNRFLMSNLCEKAESDLFMDSYIPWNRVIFSEELEKKGYKGEVSLGVTKEGGLVVGTQDQFSMKIGSLCFSADLSANDKVEREIGVFCGTRVSGSITSIVRVIALGLRDDKLFGLWYVPCKKGVAIDGISSVSGKPVNTDGLWKFTLKDWFSDALVKEAV